MAFVKLPCPERRGVGRRLGKERAAAPVHALEGDSGAHGYVVDTFSSLTASEL